MRIEGRDGGVAYRSYAARDREDGVHAHFVTAIEGRPAFIDVGRAVPVGDRELVSAPYSVAARDSVRYRDVGGGRSAVHSTRDNARGIYDV